MNSRAVITGGAGFIGHHLSQELMRRGFEVSVLDNLRRGSFARPGLSDARLIEGDVRSMEQCLDAFRGNDVVIHLAAQSNVMGSEVDHQYTFDANVTGSWNVVHAAASANVGHLIFASSREVYGEPKVLPVGEDSPIEPRNLYGASKAAAERLILNSPMRPPSVSVLRLANVIGKGDTGRVVPTWLAAARSGEPLRIFGGEQELDLVPVGFICEVFAAVIAAGGLDGPINVGSGTTTRLVDLAHHVVALTSSTSAIEIAPRRAPEVTRYRSDTAKLREVLRLTPPAFPMSSIEPDW